MCFLDSSDTTIKTLQNTLIPQAMESTTIKIINDAGVYYINGKRLGHDKLSGKELRALNNFIKDKKSSK